MHQALLEHALDRYFRELSRRVVRRYLALESRGIGTAAVELKVAPSDLVDPGDDEELANIFAQYLGQLIEDQSDLSGTLVGVSALSPSDPAYALIQRQIAERVVNVSNATRRSIQETILEGLDRNYTARQIANGVPSEDFRGLRSVVAETYANRAGTIARTEVAFIANRTTEDRYRAGGVEEVDIYDGTECGWTEHDDPDLADGSRRSLAELDDYPIAHPNCVRVPLPVVGGSE